MEKEQVKNITIFAVVEIASSPSPRLIHTKSQGEERLRACKDGSPVMNACSSYVRIEPMTIS